MNAWADLLEEQLVSQIHLPEFNTQATIA